MICSARLSSSAGTDARTWRSAGAKATDGVTRTPMRSPATSGAADKASRVRTSTRLHMVSSVDVTVFFMASIGTTSSFCKGTAICSDDAVLGEGRSHFCRTTSCIALRNSGKINMAADAGCEHGPRLSRRSPVSLRRLLIVLLCLATGRQVVAQSESSFAWLDAYRQPAARLIAEATGDSFAWRRLALLTDVAGHRLSGTPQLDKAIQWAVAEMKRDGLENVHTEPVMVPKAVRGRESAEIIEPARHAIAMLGLGESIGTAAAGVQAEALVVRSFDELDQNADKAKGRIVVCNVPFTTYNDSRPVRSNATTRAARYGGVAALVRSI